MSASIADLEAARARRIAKVPRFEILGVDELFAPLEPIPWLVEGLGIAPGAPTMFAGYGFSGKTLAAQSLALSVAVGRAAWSSLSVARAGRCVHLDFEQGRRLTRERYQRLAQAMGISRDELDGWLEASVFPAGSLCDPTVFDELCRLCDGAALLVVDSLRASAPSLEENSSEMRAPLDMLTRVSEATGVCPLVISHSRKPSESNGGGAKVAIRGSSALFDACSSVFVFTGEKGQPTHVAHEKNRLTGICSDDFALRVEDVELGDNPRAGLRVSVLGAEVLTERAERASKARVAALEEALVAFIGGNPGCGLRAVRASVEGRATAKDDALARLVARKRIREVEGTRRSRTFYLGEVGA